MSSETRPAPLAAPLNATLRLAVALLSSGRSTKSAVWFTQRAGRAWGLQDFEVFPLGSAVAVQATGADGASVSTTGQVASMDGVNCDHISRIGALVDDIERRDVAPTEAVDRVAIIEKMMRPRWWTVGGGMLLSVCVTLQVVFNIPAAAVAALTYVVGSLASWGANRIRLARIFAMGVQTMAAGAVGILAAASGLVPVADAVLAVAVVWMLLVPLPQVVSTIVDAVNAHPQAALTRATSLVAAVAGIAIGAFIAVHFARPYAPDEVSIELPTLPIYISLFFCMLGAVGNAFANAGGWDLILPAAIIGLGTGALSKFLSGPVGLDTVWAAGACATVLGFVCAVWAQRSRYSSTALALVGLTGALLPGLTVYQGIAASLAGSPNSLAYFSHAGVVVCALGIGTAFGFSIAGMLLRRRDDEKAVEQVA